MKITRIEPIVVGAPTPGCGLLSNRNYIFVKVHTDEGITGLGEATLEGYDQTIKGLLKDLENLLIGEDPTRIEYLTQVMIRQKFWKGGVLKGTAVAGIAGIFNPVANPVTPVVVCGIAILGHIGLSDQIGSATAHLLGSRAFGPRTGHEQ